MKKIFMVLLGLLASLFLLNPGAGIFVEIPDNLPLIGNLDEAAATALLLSVLSYFGLDLKNLFGRKEKEEGTIDVK